MTRQKKEIIRRIRELDARAGVCGCREYDAEIDALQEELARLSHHESYISYVMDGRWLRACGAGLTGAFPVV